MTARAAYTQIQNKTMGLSRTSLPRLPPAPGFEGDFEYMEQVRLWKDWVAWEKDDPLVLKEEDLSAYNKRIVYVYKQAIQALRFWPEIWCEAADFCFENDLEKDGTEFLTQAALANPESCLIAFKRADRIELTTTNLEGADAPVRRGKEVRDVYEKVFDALYDLINKTVEREKQALARAQEAFDQQNLDALEESDKEDDEDDEDDDNNTSTSRKKSREAALHSQLDAIKAGSQIQIKLLSRTVSTAWVALMRAMRRIQGKGKLGDAVGGSRQVFADARKRGRLTSDAYIAAAMMEYHCYKDPAGVKIFDRGLKLFPEDDVFALAYLKHLIAVNDITSKSFSVTCSD